MHPVEGSFSLQFVHGWWSIPSQGFCGCCSCHPIAGLGNAVFSMRVCASHWEDHRTSHTKEANPPQCASGVFLAPPQHPEGWRGLLKSSIGMKDCSKEAALGVGLSPSPLQSPAFSLTLCLAPPPDFCAKIIGAIHWYFLKICWLRSVVSRNSALRASPPTSWQSSVP